MTGMRVDMRVHQPVRDAVHAGIAALRVQARQIWGDDASDYHKLDEIVVRSMKTLGDLAGLARDGEPEVAQYQDGRATVVSTSARDKWRYEVQKELGNILFSTIRWIDDLGFDPIQCLILAINAQEEFVRTRRSR